MMMTKVITTVMMMMTMTMTTKMAKTRTKPLDTLHQRDDAEGEIREWHDLSVAI